MIGLDFPKKILSIITKNKIIPPVRNVRLPSCYHI